MSVVLVATHQHIMTDKWTNVMILSGTMLSVILIAERRARSLSPILRGRESPKGWVIHVHVYLGEILWEGCI
jgi:hypothetical protein